MKTMKFTLLLTTAFLLSGFNSNAGDVRSFDTRNCMWSEFVFVQPINDKWRLQLDFQYRTQSDQQYYQINPDLANIVKHPFQTAFRPWIHYYVNKKFRFSVSPMGYYLVQNYAGESTVTTPAGMAANSAFLRSPEIRTCFQICLYDQIGRFSIEQRYRDEFRWTGNKLASLETTDDFWGSFTLNPGNLLTQTTNRNRFRYLVRAKMAFKGTTIDENEFYLNAQNELFIGIGENVKNGNFLDQNRTFIGIGYKTKSKINIELGYMKIYQSQRLVVSGSTNTLHLDDDNILNLVVTFENVAGLFKKKEKKEEPAAK